MTEQWEEKLAEALEGVHPVTELGAGWEQRAMARMEMKRPAARPRRWVAVAAVAVVALFGLGFVPVPLGSAKGAWNRAMAAAAQATSVHIVGHGANASGNREGFDFETWIDGQGFSRTDHRKGGETTEVTIRNGHWYTRYDAGRAGVPSLAETYDPVSREVSAQVYGRTYLDRLFSSFKDLGTFKDMTIAERSEASLWGGKVDVVEATAPWRGPRVSRALITARGTRSACMRRLTQRRVT